MAGESHKEEPELGASSPSDEIDKVLKHCLMYVRDDLRKSTQNPKLRRENIDAVITECDFT